MRDDLRAVSQTETETAKTQVAASGRCVGGLGK